MLYWLFFVGDAASMFIDVCSYLCNIYGEWCRDSYGRLGTRTKFLLDVIIPGLSILSLLAITAYITTDAINILSSPPVNDNVDVTFLYAYSFANLIVDIVCAGMFYCSSSQAFVEPDYMPMLSLDTAISFDSDEEFGQLDDDMEEIYFNSNANSASNSYKNGNGYKNSKSGRSNSVNSNSANANEANGKISGTIKNNRIVSQNGYEDIDDDITKNVTDSNSSKSNFRNLHGHSNKNLNMMSAFVHILGDTLRTFAVFGAALVSSLTGIDGDICDAWAAIIVAISTLTICLPLIFEIIHAAYEISLVSSDNELETCYGYCNYCTYFNCFLGKSSGTNEYRAIRSVSPTSKSTASSSSGGNGIQLFTNHGGMKYKMVKTEADSVDL